MGGVLGVCRSVPFGAAKSQRGPFERATPRKQDGPSPRVVEYVGRNAPFRRRIVTLVRPGRTNPSTMREVTVWCQRLDGAVGDPTPFQEVGDPTPFQEAGGRSYI